MHLICHITVSCKFMCGSLQNAGILVSLVTITISIKEMCFWFVTWSIGTTCLNGYIYGWQFLKMSYHHAMFGEHWSCANRDVTNHVIKKSSNEWGLFMICHHLGQFGRNGLCCNWEMFLVCHVFKQDHGYLSDYRYCDIGGIMVLICHVILQDQFFKVSHDFIGWSISR